MQEINDLAKEVFGEGYVGYAVEAGAFDGVFESTTIGLEKLGWKVLLVEPLPHAFAKLLTNRDNTYCLQYALADYNKNQVDFTAFHDNFGGASFSSLIPQSEALSMFSPKEGTPLKVNVRTLDYCLEAVEFPTVDILSLDIEGGEICALDGFDFEKWNPKMLILENLFATTEIEDYVKTKGYIKSEVFLYNEIYIKEARENK